MSERRNGNEHPDPATLFDEYRRRRSRSVRNQLVEMYTAVADSSARRFAGRGESVDDLRQVAFIGLIKAIERFDPSRGVPFESFARPTINGELKRHFRDRTWRVSVPRRVKEMRSAVFAALDQLHQELGRSPTPDELAVRLDVDRDVILETLDANRIYRLASLDPTQGELPSGVAEVATEPCDQGALDRVEAIEAFQTLSERRRKLLYWRFYEDCTQSEIGERLGVGQVQVSRLLRATMAELVRAQAAESEPPAPDVVERR